MRFKFRGAFSALVAFSDPEAAPRSLCRPLAMGLEFQVKIRLRVQSRRCCQCTRTRMSPLMSTGAVIWGGSRSSFTCKMGPLRTYLLFASMDFVTFKGHVNETAVCSLAGAQQQGPTDVPGMMDSGEVGSGGRGLLCSLSGISSESARGSCKLLKFRAG